MICSAGRSCGISWVGLRIFNFQAPSSISQTVTCFVAKVKIKTRAITVLPILPYRSEQRVSMSVWAHDGFKPYILLAKCSFSAGVKDSGRTRELHLPLANAWTSFFAPCSLVQISSNLCCMHIPEPHHSGQQHLQPGGQSQGAGMMQWSKPGHQSPPADCQSSRLTSNTLFSPGSYKEKRHQLRRPVSNTKKPKQNKTCIGRLTDFALLMSASDTAPWDMAFTWATAALITFTEDSKMSKFSESVDPGIF